MNSSRIRILAAIVGMTLGMGLATSHAQQGRQDDRRGHGDRQSQQPQAGRPSAQAEPQGQGRKAQMQGDRQRHGQQTGAAQSRNSPSQDKGRGVGPGQRFHAGDKLPADYRNSSYVINDWRDHRLDAPPRGHQWVQVGADYVLAAIATGLIVKAVLGH